MRKNSLLLVGLLFGARVVCSSDYQNPRLINVKKLAPGIVVDIRYATTDNFAHQKLYPVGDVCLLCEPAAERLARVQRNLEKQGLGLKVWDCYRPISVQKKLWDIVPDDRYVANPKTGSRHNRGASVDLTLVDKNGDELEMPTVFDEFSEKAHRNFMDLPAAALKNRALLQSAMEAEGFLPLPTEWWHFDSPEWSQYALRDEPLGDTSLLTDKFAVPSETTQFIKVSVDGMTARTGRLQRFEKIGSEWKPVGEAWPVSVGVKGVVRQTDKKEGDNKAPLGVFKLGRAYGYAESAPDGSAWPYQHVDEHWRCVDDPDSPRYNQIFRPDPAEKKNWKSAELMKRNDHLYKWVINIEQNSPAKAGCGSCIFLHVWRKPNSPTEGCTAMAEENMVELLRWLKPDAHPVLMQTLATIGAAR